MIVKASRWTSRRDTGHQIYDRAKKMNNDNFALPFAAASTACKCFHLHFEGASLAYMLHSFDHLAVRSAKDLSADFPTSLAIRLASDSKKKGGWFWLCHCQK